jgi:hypothetical protein
MFKTLIDKLTGRKILFYGSMFGNYDVLQEVPKLDKGCDKWIFTDGQYETKSWKIINPEPIADGDSMLNSRYHKLNYRIPEDYDYCVYLDTSFAVARPDYISFMLDQLGDKKLVFMKHPWRDCIYDETDVCLTMAKYDHTALKRQMGRYEKEGMPRHFGLWACGNFAFKNDKETKEFFKAWWDELSHESNMDQISLPYLAWKMNFKDKINTIDLDYYYNIYTSQRPL